MKKIKIYAVSDDWYSIGSLLKIYKEEFYRDYMRHVVQMQNFRPHDRGCYRAANSYITFIKHRHNNEKIQL